MGDNAIAKFLITATAQKEFLSVCQTGNALAIKNYLLQQLEIERLSKREEITSKSPVKKQSAKEKFLTDLQAVLEVVSSDESIIRVSLITDDAIIRGCTDEVSFKRTLEKISESRKGARALVLHSYFLEGMLFDHTLNQIKDVQKALRFFESVSGLSKTTVYERIAFYQLIKSFPILIHSQQDYSVLVLYSKEIVRVSVSDGRFLRLLSYSSRQVAFTVDSNSTLESRQPDLDARESLEEALNNLKISDEESEVSVNNKEVVEYSEFQQSKERTRVVCDDPACRRIFLSKADVPLCQKPKHKGTTQSHKTSPARCVCENFCQC